jgi:aldehyde dehydrogenase (NAD+)
LKPSEDTPASSLEFAKLVEEAGFPPGVVNVVTGFGEEAGAALVNHPDVDKLAFTGSTETGISVAKGAAANVTKVSLELGGKSPNIVFEDAEIGNAANGIVAGIFAATGQTCIAGARLLVHDNVHDELLERLVERAKSIKLGDPSDMKTEMGPVATEAQLEKIKKYVQIGIDEGATLVCGGKQPSDPNLSGGLFFESTIFTNVTNDMRIAQDEIFGPVLCVIRFSDEDEAIEIANDTKYGLAAGIWTKDFRKAYRVARKIKAGTVWINSYRTVSYASPFGGYKMSGYGRENGIEAIKEYTQVKSIWVELSGEVRDPFKLG